MYYDTESIIIYDSLQRNKLHKHHKLFIQQLFPTYAFDKKPTKFIYLQQTQLNGSDCGVFAIAYATSLSFGSKPETITYDQGAMRQHLVDMFEKNTIQSFPVKALNIITRLVEKNRTSYVDGSEQFTPVQT